MYCRYFSNVIPGNNSAVLVSRKHDAHTTKFLSQNLCRKRFGAAGVFRLLPLIDSILSRKRINILVVLFSHEVGRL